MWGKIRTIQNKHNRAYFGDQFDNCKQPSNKQEK